MMKKIRIRYIQQGLLILTVLFLHSASMYYKQIARVMAGNFLPHKAGPYFLVSDLFLVAVGIVLFFLLPMGKNLVLNRQNILYVTLIGIIPFLTLVGRISFRMFLSQSFIPIIMSNYYLLQWTVVSSVPLTWLGLVFGWWLREVWHQYRRRMEGLPHLN